MANLVDLKDPTKMIGNNVAILVEGKEGAPERGLLNSFPDFPWIYSYCAIMEATTAAVPVTKINGPGFAQATVA